MDYKRMSPAAWSSRCTSIGVSDSGRPVSRPTLRATSYALREATTACCSDNDATG